MTVVGWADAYLAPYSQVTFTKERKQALVERIRKRRYNFNYSDHLTLPHSAPFYNDNVYCILTKPQWDSVMNEVYKDELRGPRLLPMDVITSSPKNGVLFEKEKFEPKGGDKNG